MRQKLSRNDLSSCCARRASVLLICRCLFKRKLAAPAVKALGVITLLATMFQTSTSALAKIFFFSEHSPNVGRHLQPQPNFPACLVAGLALFSRVNCEVAPLSTEKCLKNEPVVQIKRESQWKWIYFICSAFIILILFLEHF